MNKLTDAEIVKALECCITNDCAKCKAYDETNGEIVDCLHAICRNALALINRQKAEIERLKEHEHIIEKMLSEAWERIAELDRLNETAKSEAIKEFWEKVKQEFQGVKHILPTAYLIGDKIVKEMTEQTTFEKVEHNSLCETETYKGGV